MARIRKVEIANFRSIQKLELFPSNGINCLIGPGDSGKSTILDAIDFCLGARRNLQFTDADFYNLSVEIPIVITVTIGDLSVALKNFDNYGLYLRGFNRTTGQITDEPEAGNETVLSLQMTVGGDLEPKWSLVSERAIAAGQSRTITWEERIRLAPTRLGSVAEQNLSWRRGSVLNKLSDERADASAALLKASRDARTAFGRDAQGQLATTLATVADAARRLGVDVGGQVQALIDAHSVSFSGGTISLHDTVGVPLRSLGLGSSRLLIAGLQRAAALDASIILVDELEYGLEPHRIIRLLDALGSKDNEPLQVFMTTHSPVAVRELTARQLNIVRRLPAYHYVYRAVDPDGLQGTIRSFPEALLSQSILVCEGASEVGFVRGIDRVRVAAQMPAITAHGLSLVDGGGDPMFARALDLQALGYRVAVLRDSDANPTPDKEQEFLRNGGAVFAWRAVRALEDELFLSVPDDVVYELVAYACELKDEILVNEHIKSMSNNVWTLPALQALELVDTISTEVREMLGRASRSRKVKSSWFKSVSAMEHVAASIVGPRRAQCDPQFFAIVDSVFDWVANGR